MAIQIAFILKDVLYLSVIALLSYLFYKERKSLLDRIMADSYKEYEYFQNMYKKDIKEAEKIRKDERAKAGEDEEIKKEMDIEYKKEKDFLDQLEEDFAEEEVDLPKLREQIKE